MRIARCAVKPAGALMRNADGFELSTIEQQVFDTMPTYPQIVCTYGLSRALRHLRLGSIRSALRRLYDAGCVQPMREPGMTLDAAP